MVGVGTKLKYHSRPIHITPQTICSQRSEEQPEGRSVKALDGAIDDDQQEREHKARDHHIAQIAQKRGHGRCPPAAFEIRTADFSAVRAQRIVQSPCMP